MYAYVHNIVDACCLLLFNRPDSPLSTGTATTCMAQCLEDILWACLCIHMYICTVDAGLFSCLVLVGYYAMLVEQQASIQECT